MHDDEFLVASMSCQATARHSFISIILIRCKATNCTEHTDFIEKIVLICSWFTLLLLMHCKATSNTGAEPQVPYNMSRIYGGLMALKNK